MATSGTLHPGTNVTDAQLIVHLLTTVACIPGGAALLRYDALSQSTRIHHVLARHVQGTDVMAQGMPSKDGQQSRIWLLIADNQRRGQMISQVEKLEDVLQVKRHREHVRVCEPLGAFVK